MSETELSAQDVLRVAIDLVDLGAALDPGFARDVLNAAAELSSGLPVTQHPLGFMHLDLSGLAAGGAARLHLWTEEFLARADPLGRLHDHTWELRSTVLVGELTDHVLDPVQDVAGEYTAHRVHYDKHGNQVESLPSRWRLDEFRVRSVRQGESYNLAPRLVHRTEVSVLPTATLVVPVEHGGQGPKVFAPHQLTGMGAAPREPIDAGAASSALRSAAKQAAG